MSRLVINRVAIDARFLIQRRENGKRKAMTTPGCAQASSQVSAPGTLAHSSAALEA
jgi:hypothetical protein